MFVESLQELGRSPKVRNLNRSKVIPWLVQTFVSRARTCGPSEEFWTACQSFGPCINRSGWRCSRSRLSSLAGLTSIYCCTRCHMVTLLGTSLTNIGPAVTILSRQVLQTELFDQRPLTSHPCLEFRHPWKARWNLVQPGSIQDLGRCRFELTHWHPAPESSRQRQEGNRPDYWELVPIAHQESR